MPPVPVLTRSYLPLYYKQTIKEITVILTLQVASNIIIIDTVEEYVIFSDVPRHIVAFVTYQEGEMYFTAVIELGDMFYGGGVPIDHYIIQVEDGTVLETPGPTYSFDIMYNTSLSVNISAHNCAGYSDPFPLVVQYDDEG